MLPLRRFLGKVIRPLGPLGLVMTFVAACSTLGNRTPQSDSGWNLESVAYDTGASASGTVMIRSGYFRETGAKFSGNLLYLEDVGDSFKNHEPLFRKLSKAGYRIIVFDNPGQGTSEGSLNNLRIYDDLKPASQISALAGLVWERFRRSDSGSQRKVVLGAGTGGLAAYELAYQQWPDAVVLLAPALFPKRTLGESALAPRLLTSANYLPGKDPHLEPVRPDSPFEAPLFFANLRLTAKLAKGWRIERSVQGIVFLAGPGDVYVDSERAESSIRKNATHFEIATFPDSLHEIDNEKPAIQQAFIARLLQFLDSLM